ncbi:MAG: Ppx/GppA family phosphatase [Balneolaceae bacterium]|nr:Ppx/GppA family phosphatase [Balneolaceae bacterium]
MIASSIDIGTNSVLLLVAEVADGQISVLKELEAVPRLGRGVDENRKLHIESQQRVLKVLNHYKSFLDENYPSISLNTVVTATSAVRDASNRDEFIDLVAEKTGWNIRLLSGNEEAQTTYMGALSVLNGQQRSNNLVFDIGGGSTELAFGEGLNLMQFASIDMGSVRFTERFIKNYPPDRTSIELLRNSVKLLLNETFQSQTDFDLIGVAGTVTSIAAIHFGMSDYDSSVLNGSVLGQKAIREFTIRFREMKPEEIETAYPKFLTGRGEVILAGLLIMDEILTYFNKSEITVSTGGIRHGILLDS